MEQLWTRKGVAQSWVVLGLLVGTLAVWPAEAGTIEHEDDEAGFSGYVWGTAPSNCPSLKLIRELGSTDYAQKVELYTDPDEDLTLNQTTLLAIQYRFVDDQLESIEIKYKGRESREKLMQWVEERYGRLTAHERRVVTQVEWVGELTGVTLTYNARTGHGTLWFYSQSLYQQYFDTFPWGRI